MIPIQYTYLVGSIISLVPLFFIFLFRKDLVREVVIMGVGFMILAVPAEYYLWTVDYWKPYTVTGTRIGIEDFILGFANGGFLAVIYEFFLRKKHRLSSEKKNTTRAFIITVAMVGTISILFWGFHINSSIATPVGMLMPLILILVLRKDLITYSLISGAIATIFVIPIYVALEYLTPGFTEKTWLFSLLTNIRVLGIPIEDIVYYYLLAALLGPLYLFWQNEYIAE